MNAINVEGVKKCEEVVDIHSSRPFTVEITVFEDLLDLVFNIEVIFDCDVIK